MSGSKFAIQAVDRAIELILHALHDDPTAREFAASRSAHCFQIGALGVRPRGVKKRPAGGK